MKWREMKLEEGKGLKVIFFPCLGFVVDVMLYVANAMLLEFEFFIFLLWWQTPWIYGERHGPYYNVFGALLGFLIPFGCAS